MKIKSRNLLVVLIFTLVFVYTHAQQGAYHDALIENKSSGIDQWPIIIGLAVIFYILYEKGIIKKK